MLSSLLNASPMKASPPNLISSSKFSCSSLSNREMERIISCGRKSELSKSRNHGLISYSLANVQIVFQKSVIPLAASLAIVLFSNPAHAGLFSGFSGLESIPGPQLPQIDFISRFNEENQKKYAENDARFKESPILKKLLERTELNKQKNRQATLDKYCIRGAEWGVGDCSAEAMSPEERDKFISMLKEKAGVE